LFYNTDSAYQNHDQENLIYFFDRCLIAGQAEKFPEKTYFPFLLERTMVKYVPVYEIHFRIARFPEASE